MHRPARQELGQLRTVPSHSASRVVDDFSHAVTSSLVSTALNGLKAGESSAVGELGLSCESRPERLGTGGRDLRLT